MTSKKIVVLISGSGSNLQAFIDAANTNALSADITAVISNRADAYGLERAKNAGIATEIVDHTCFQSRESFDTALKEAITPYNPDVIILAGFMRILTADFVRHFQGKLLNIHPSLLPKYPGLNTHQRAIDAGDNKAGATVHFVTEELDGGPAIIQASVSIEKQDDANQLAKKILPVEHKIYPLAAQWLIENRIQLINNNTVMDGKTLAEGGFQFIEQ